MGVTGQGHVLNGDFPPPGPPPPPHGMATSYDKASSSSYSGATSASGGGDRDLFEWGDSAYFSDGCRGNETLFEAMRSG